MATAFSSADVCTGRLDADKGPYLALSTEEGPFLFPALSLLPTCTFLLELNPVSIHRTVALGLERRTGAGGPQETAHLLQPWALTTEPGLRVSGGPCCSLYSVLFCLFSLQVSDASLSTAPTVLSSLGRVRTLQPGVTQGTVPRVQGLHGEAVRSPHTEEMKEGRQQEGGGKNGVGDYLRGRRLKQCRNSSQELQSEKHELTGRKVKRAAFLLILCENRGLHGQLSSCFASCPA